MNQVRSTTSTCQAEACEAPACKLSVLLRMFQAAAAGFDMHRMSNPRIITGLLGLQKLELHPCQDSTCLPAASACPGTRPAGSKDALPACCRDVISSKDAVKIAKDAFQKKRSCQEIADLLTERAYRKYSSDNVAVIVIDFGGPAGGWEASKPTGGLRGLFQ